MRCITTHLSNGLFLLLSIFVLSGCGASIKSALPDSEITITAPAVSEVLTFSVTGPTKGARYYWGVRGTYAGGDSGFSLSTGVNDKTFDYTVNVDTHRALFVEIICTLATQDIGSGEWIERDSVTWEVSSRDEQVAPDWIGDVFVRNMNDVEALEGMTSISGSIVIDDISFEVFDFLSGVTDIGGGLFVGDIAGLESLSDVGITSVPSFMPHLKIVGNHELISLVELQNLQTVDSGLRISDNPLLENLAGLDNVTSVGRDLSVVDNASLRDLSGLDNISSVGENLYVTNNQALTSLAALSNLSTIGEWLYITHNENLCTSEAEALVDQVGLQRVPAYYKIDNNLDCSALD